MVLKAKNLERSRKQKCLRWYIESTCRGSEANVSRGPSQSIYMFRWTSGGLHHVWDDQDSRPWSRPCEGVGGTLPALWFRLKMMRKCLCRSRPWLYFLMLQGPCVQKGRMWCFWLYNLLHFPTLPNRRCFLGILKNIFYQVHLPSHP